jgi:hypothetical protein
VTNPHDPDRPSTILRHRDDSLSAALLGGIAIAMVLFLGAALYLYSSGNPNVASTESPRIERTTPAPSTTGQGGTQVMPGPDQNIPNPSKPPSPPAAK